MKQVALVVAGFVFSIIALVHVWRLIYHWQIMIAGFIIPMSVSIIALIISVILAAWMFSAAWNR